MSLVAAKLVHPLTLDIRLGVMPLQLELGELGPYALDTDDTVISTGVVSKDAVSSLVETVEASRTFSSAGTAFKVSRLSRMHYIR